MSVVFAAERADQRTGTGSADGSRRYTRMFWVVTDDVADGPFTVQTCGLIPQVYDAYIAGNDVDMCARVESVTPLNPNHDGTYWDVRVEYTTTTNQEVPNPLLRPSQVTWGFQNYQKPIFKDINGDAILNKASQFFDPLPEIDDARPTVTIVKNLPVFDGTLASGFVNSINSLPWLNGAPETWKCLNIGSIERQEGCTWFWETTFEFQYRYETWKLFVLNAGRQQLVSGKLRDCTDDQGNSVMDAVQLDDQGAQVASPTINTAIILEFDVYRQNDFNSLGLP